MKTELLTEYDFSKGKRGKYAARYADGTHIVRLDPDVAALFPDGESVRLVAQLAKLQRGRARRTAPRPVSR